MEKGNQTNGLGIAALILGIIALLLSCVAIGGFIGVVALILGIIGATRKNVPHGTSIAGIVLGTLSIGIVIVIMIFVSDTTPAKEVSKITPVETGEVASTSNSVKEPDSSELSNSEDKNIFSVGEIAEYKNVQVAVLKYNESNGNDWGEPGEGKVFVFPEVEIINNSDKEISISSLMSFEVYCDEYKTDFSSNAMMAMSTDDMQQLDGSIAPGKRLKGSLGLEVPSDWKTIEIYYKDNVWADSNFQFIISK